MTANIATARKKTLPTHELFDVQEWQGQRPFWKKVGAAFENKDASHLILVYQPGMEAPKRLQLRSIDRNKRPLKEEADPKRSPTHELFLVVGLENGPNEWKRVGVGFTNKDGSLSLIVDDGLREGPKARFHMRLRRDRSDAPPHNEPVQRQQQTSDDNAAAAKTPMARTLVRKRSAA